MGKATENTPDNSEKELLLAQEKIAKMEEELKAAQEAKAKAEEEAKAALEQITASKSAMSKATVPVDEERVTIKLFKDTKEYKDDLTVVVNGKAFKIQRGVEVSVPKYVAEVIEHSAAQDEKTAQLIEGLIADTEQREKEMR